MTKQTPPRRRSLLVVLATASALSAVLVLGLTRGDGGVLGALLRGGSTHEPGEGLSAAAPTAEPVGSRPSLLGAERPKPRETHGPVTVTVVDLADAPVEGVRVRAVWQVKTPEGEVTSSASDQVTDVFGRSVFADLPYDGTASVAAHARGEPRPGGGITWSGDSVATFTQGNGDGSGAGGVLRFFVAEGPLPSGEPGDAPAQPMTELASLTSIDFGAPGLVLAQATVLGPEVRLRIDRGVPFRLDVREGGDGRAHPAARWRVTPHLLADAETWGAATLPVKRGEEASVHVEVEAPRGTVARMPADYEAWIHPDVERLEAVYPLRPSVEVIVVFPPEVLPFRLEDWTGTVTVAGVEASQESLRMDAQGRLRLEGSSYMSGEAVSVQGTLRDRYAVSGQALMGAGARDAVVVVARCDPLPEVPTQSLDLSAALNVIRVWRSSSSFTPLEVRFDGGRIQWVQGLGGVALRNVVDLRLNEPVPPRGTVEVRAVRADGSPVAGARVRIQGARCVSDARGLARKDDLTPGDVEVVLLGAGASTRIVLPVRAGATAQTTLRADHGGTLDVEVVDELGRGLPYARIELAQSDNLPWIDYLDGVQRIDPYTDAEGRRTLRAVSLGKAKVTARFGTRSAEVEVDVTENGVFPVRLVLPSVVLPEHPKDAEPAEGAPAPPPPAPPAPPESIEPR